MAPHVLQNFFTNMNKSRNIKATENDNNNQELALVEIPVDAQRSIKGVGAAALYGVCSVSTAFVNKILMTTYGFDFPVAIMVLQMVYTILLLEALSFFNVVNVPRFTLQQGKRFALPAICYAINSILALSALSHMNVAMYGVLKRCVPIATLALSVVLMKKGCPSKLTILAVTFLSFGCLIAGYGDLKFNLLAYTCGALSNITQALYLLLVQWCAEKDMTTIETLHLNSINTLPLLVITALFKGEFTHVMAYADIKNPVFIVILFIVINMGCLLNFTLFLCTSLTSALTTSVVGGIKALAQTIVGLFTFGGVSINVATFLGIGMNSTGGILYIYAKYADNRKRSGGPKKIISLSTAEDFKNYKEEQTQTLTNHVDQSLDGRSPV